MLKNKKSRIAAVGVIAVSLVGITALSAAAAPVPSGSQSGVYLVDPNTGAHFPSTTTFAWDDNTVAVPGADGTDINAPFTCPTGTTGAETFIAPVGSERTISSWKAYAVTGFTPSPVVAGAKEMQLVDFTLPDQNLGAVSAVKAAGGNYSVGVACLKDNLVNFASATAGVWFTTAHVTATTGAYTMDVPDATVVTPPAGPTSGAFTQNLTATTIAGSDGTLNLVAPASASVAIGNPTLVNHLSTSTGTLGQFTVQDSRVVTHPGWTLATTVADFVNSSDATNTIGKAQLGLNPVEVSTTAAGVTLGAEQVAGSAVYPASFAAADNSAAVGNSVFNANLTFVAPANKPAGTYTSTLTITLASK